MKPLLNWSLILLIVFTFGCKEDKPTQPGPGPGTTPTTTATIGAGGGKIETAGFELTVPQGAFADSTEIRLYELAADNPFDESKNSNLFKLEGIPNDFTQPIVIKIKYADSASGSPFVGVGMDSYARTANSARTSYFVDTAVDSGSFLTYSIQPPTPTSLHKTFGVKSTGYVTMFLMALAGYNTYFSANGHFAIAYPDKVNPNQVGKLGGYLENAYSVYQNLGFVYSSRILWPIHVTVKTLDADGYFNSSLLGDNFANLEIDGLLAIDMDDALKSAASHEFFHMVQYFYYPYHGFGSLWYETYTWLDEATASWAEELFSEQTNYVPDVREKDTRRMAPFKGVQYGNSPDAQAHGYGLSGMIKYLIDRYNTGCLVKIYNEVNNDNHPIDAVRLATAAPGIWWEDFMAKYVLGDVYTDMTLQFLLDNVHDFFNIRTAADTLAKFTANYPDLSGRIYDIDLNYPELDPNAKMQLTVNGGFTSVAVFKYRDTTIEKISGSSASVEISDIKNLQADGYDLIAMVTNSRVVAPYTAEANLELEIKVVKPGVLDIFSYRTGKVQVKWRGTYQKAGGSPVQFEPSRWYEAEGTWNDYTFTGVSDDGSYRDSIKISIDPNTLGVTNYEAYWTAYSDNSTESVTGSNLTLVKVDNEYKAEVLGVSSCSYISSLTDVSGSSDPYILISYDCSADSYIRIIFEQ